MFRLTLVCLCVLLFVPVFADVVTLREQGKTPLPLNGTEAVLVPAEEPLVAMEAETVKIVESPANPVTGYETIVICGFTMKSYADKPITRLMAFPIVDPQTAGLMLLSFVVGVDGEFVQTSYYDCLKTASQEELRDWRPDDRAMKYAGYITWPVTWQPGETKRIGCRYYMGEHEGFRHATVEGWQLRYVVRTGALWRGHIGTADISITFRDNGGPMFGPVGPTQPWTKHLTYAENAKWLSPTQVQWHFENWEPTDDICVQFVRWTGINGQFRYPFPAHYAGAEQRYTAEMLDAQVERELAPWQPVFPKEVAQCDRAAVRALIAEALYYEIFARHGDPFITGIIGDPRPADVSSESRGYYYGKWHAYFETSMYHGGWYRPDVKKKTKVSLEELNETERANLEFLKGIFAQ